MPNAAVVPAGVGSSVTAFDKLGRWTQASDVGFDSAMPQVCGDSGSVVDRERKIAFIVEGSGTANDAETPPLGHENC